MSSEDAIKEYLSFPPADLAYRFLGFKRKNFLLTLIDSSMMEVLSNELPFLFELKENVGMVFHLDKELVQSRLQLFLSFIDDKNLRYYAKLESHKDGEFAVSKIFREEGRSEERIIGWPKLKAFCSIQAERAESNVISFQTKKSGGSADVIRYRVVDLSATGLSFILDRDAAKNFSVGKSVNAILEVEGQDRRLIIMKIMHLHEYIDGLISNSVMTKIGVRLEQTPNLEDILSRYQDFEYATTDEKALLAKIQKMI